MSRKSDRKARWFAKMDALTTPEARKLLGRGKRDGEYWDLAAYYHSIKLTPAQAAKRLDEVEK